MQNFKEDFDSFEAKTPLSDGVDRRGFLKTAFGNGFAGSGCQGWQRCPASFKTHSVT